MTWQYRIMRRVDGGKMTHRYSYGIYGIYEVHSRPKRWTKDAMEPSGDTLAELKSDYEYMAEAFKLPVLDYKTGKPIKKGKGEK